MVDALRPDTPEPQREPPAFTTGFTTPADDIIRQIVAEYIGVAPQDIPQTVEELFDRVTICVEGKSAEEASQISWEILGIASLIRQLDRIEESHGESKAIIHLCQTLRDHIRSFQGEEISITQKEFETLASFITTLGAFAQGEEFTLAPEDIQILWLFSGSSGK